MQVRDLEGACETAPLLLHATAEGWYIRVISPKHSCGIVTGYFPEQTPKVGQLGSTNMQPSKPVPQLPAEAWTC